MGAAKRRRDALGPAYGAPPSWAWHYTLGRKIPLILRDGALRDAWMDGNRDRFGRCIPYSIWLTTAETVDPTSVPALTLAKFYQFDRDAFKCCAGGAWRIGYNLPHPSITTYEDALALHPVGSPFRNWCRKLPSKGANRKQWRVAWEPLGLAGCRIEEQQGMRWVPHFIEALSLDDNGPGYGMPGLAVELSADEVVDCCRLVSRAA
jgi:hypothetical protein